MSSSSPQTILFLSAAPEGTQRLRFDQEVRDLREGLERSKHRDRFTLADRHASRPRDLHRAVLDEHPRILHFSGHGSERGEILLEGDGGRPHRVTTEDLAELFRLLANHLDCVLLNACFTEAQAQAIASSIPFVIGMRREIEDRAAIFFMSGFYDALGSGLLYDQAFEHGLARLRLETKGWHDVPQLIQGPRCRNQEIPPLDPRGPDPARYAEIDGLSPAELQNLIRRYEAVLDFGKEDTDVHYALGLLFLEARMHDSAIQHFERNLTLNPDNAVTHYYLGLSLLRGRRPRFLRKVTAKRIEEQLATSLALDESAPLPRYLLAYIRYDYYLGNGLVEPQPEHHRLLNEALHLSTDPWEARRLLHNASIASAQIRALVEHRINKAE